MTSDDKFLRKKAEDLYEKREHVNISSLNSAEIEKLITGLELKNIEYEFRNEELISERDIAASAAAKFNTFYESAAMGYFTLNPDSTITEMNMSGASMLGGGRSDLVNRKFRSFVSPETLAGFDDFLRNIFKSDSSLICEVRLKIENNIKSFIHIEGIISSTEDKCYINVMDITDRKLAEETVYNLLNEKELILKEVHHRVKNNMYNIGALLNMQANARTDEAAKNVLFDAAGRVQSMSVLYDKLYRSKHTAAVSLKEYFPDLIYEIAGIFPQKKFVKIKTDIEDIVLDAKILSILGILVNEIITNSMKYAFTGRNDGVINVTASKTDDKIIITIADDGEGIPESVTFENSTGFGMQLVGMLTEQLEGSIKIERGEGTRFVLEFTV
jgi:PAS domain S-box-containing protein